MIGYFRTGTQRSRRDDGINVDLACVSSSEGALTSVVQVWWRPESRSVGNGTANNDPEAANNVPEAARNGEDNGTSSAIKEMRRMWQDQTLTRRRRL